MERAIALQKLKDLYERNHLPQTEYDFADAIISDMWIVLQKQGIVAIDQISEDALDSFLFQLLSSNRSTIEAYIALMRYFKINGAHSLYIHLTKYTGILDVVDSIINRLERLQGTLAKNEIIADLDIPVLGYHPRIIPQFTKTFMERLEAKYPEAIVQAIITGNNHQVSTEAMLPEKIEYENSDSLESYLIARHVRKVKELQAYCDQNKVWFEQHITQEVVDYVASNQEILSAKLIDQTLYITKIPYDTVAFLHAQDEIHKRYYACHCGFARESILQENGSISKNWCYCSAGFAKHPFEVILGQKLPIKCLKSALDHDLICRFSIDLSNVEYKK